MISDRLIQLKNEFNNYYYTFNSMSRIIITFSYFKNIVFHSFIICYLNCPFKIFD